MTNSKEVAFNLIMGGNASEITSLVRAMLKFLEQIPEEKDRLELFQHACEKFKDVPRSAKNIPSKALTIEEIRALGKTMGGYCSEFLNHLYLKRLSTEEFSKQLWDFIQQFPSENEKIFAFAVIFGSKLMPYQKLPDASEDISGTKFQITLNKYKKEVALSDIILNAKFGKKSEVSAALLTILDQIEPQVEKVIVLAAIIGKIEDRIEDFYQKEINQYQEIIGNLQGRTI